MEAWIGRGRQAEADPAFVMPIALPAELPAFAEVEPCPTEHLQAMLAARSGPEETPRREERLSWLA